jgi:fibronectin-binding autotransporter adhesin
MTSSLSLPATTSSLRRPGSRARRRAVVGLAALFATLGAGHALQAASANWAAAPTNGMWFATTGEINWSTGDGTFPGDISGTITNTTDDATFNVNSPITQIEINSTAGVATPLNIENIGFSGDALATNYVIGSTTGNALILSGNANSGATTSQIFISGALRANAATAVTATINAPVILAAQSATLPGFGVFQNNSTSLTSGDALVFNGPVSGGATSESVTLTLRGANINTGNAINGVISDGGAAKGVAVIKRDAGVWTLTGANTYTGGTTAAGGTLVIAGSANLGVTTLSGGTLRINSSGTVSTTGGISQTAFNGNLAVVNGTLVTGGVTTTGNSNGRTLTLTGGTLQSNGDLYVAGTAVEITLNGGTIKSGNAAGITINDYNNVIATGAGGATLDTTTGNITSTAVLTGTLAGPIAVTGGNTFRSGINNTGSFTLQNNSTWDINGQADQIVRTGALVGTDGVITNTGAAQTLTINFTGTAGSYAGTIAGGAAIAVAKAGTGAQTLSGANTFSGGLTITNGTLVAGSASALGAGNVTVSGDGTAVGVLASSLANINAVGDVAVSGGSLDLNTSGVGSLTLAADKNFTMTAGTWNVTLATAGSGDRVLGSGSGTFNISDCAIALSGTPAYGSTYSLFPGFASGTVTNVTITGYDTTNYAATLSSAGVLSFTSTATDGFTAWQSGIAWNGGDSSASGDPDGDGQVNLLEYALGADPVAASSTGSLATAVASNRLTLTFNRIADPALTYTVQASSDLTAWSDIFTSTGGSNTAGPVVVTDTQDLTARRFLRLVVTH